MFQSSNQLHDKLEPSELAILDDFLQNNTPEEEINLCWLDGYLSAICNSPRLVMPSEWQTYLMPDAKFESMEQANQIFNLLTRFYNNTVKSIRDRSFLPIYENEDCKEILQKGSNDKISLAKNWCNAYIEGTHLANPELLKESKTRENEMIIAALFPIIICSGKIPEKELKKEKISLSDMIDKVPLAVKFLSEEYEKYREAYLPKRSKQIIKDNLPKRNDLCTCGSGKKFKKCCLN